MLICIGVTRLQDFERFVGEWGLNPTGGYSLSKAGWQQRGYSWKNPWFAQTGNHPVCRVSYEDANEFCRWLTRQEQAGGRLQTGCAYRLPTEAEWSQAVGPATYPWGGDFPPPSGWGNYAGLEVKNAD